MSKAVIGIDPGKYGAIVGIANDVVTLQPIPLIGGKVDMVKLYEDFRENITFNPDFKNAVVFIEKVGSRPKQKGMFEFGRVVGMLEMMIVCRGFALERVSPQKWQKILPTFKKGASKKAALLYVKERFPNFWDAISEEGSYTKKEQEGLIDAFLIAQYGRGQI